MARRNKRSPGEGSIYQRADGLWCGSVDMGIVNGKRRRRTVCAKTRKAVVAKLEQLKREQADGLERTPERVTVAHYLESWLEQVIRGNRAPRTYRSYADTVHLHISPHLGHHELTKLTPAHVQTMVNELASAGLGRTVDYARSVLSRALNRALKWGLVPRNVAALVDVPASDERAQTPLDADQARRLLDAARAHRLEALFRVALGLGLRKGELIGLRWGDIDFDKDELRISGAIQRVDGKLERSAPKTRRSIRTLPLSPGARRVFLQHRQRQERERQQAADQWHDHDLVFPTAYGTPLDPRSLSHQFKQLLAQAGLPTTFRFHDLRHTFVSLALASGADLRALADLAGHASVTTTADIYAHSLPATRRSATDAIDALLNAESIAERTEEE